MLNILSDNNAKINSKNNKSINEYIFNQSNKRLDVSNVSRYLILRQHTPTSATTCGIHLKLGPVILLE